MECVQAVLGDALALMGLLRDPSDGKVAGGRHKFPSFWMASAPI
jgi:hypothetical protein